MAFDRNRFRQGLSDSTQFSADSANDRGGFKSYVKKGKRPRYTKIPEGTFVFDVIPYMVGNDFGDTSRRFTANSPQYNMDLWVHMDVGANNDQVVCLAKTFGKPCPICEEKARREAQGEQYEQLKPFNPKRRCLYNIWIHDASRTEEAKGVQILEIAHFTLEKNLVDIAKNPITGQMTVFADPDNGKHVCFTRKGTGKTNTTYSGHQFIDRQMPIPDAILEQAEDLTTLIDIPTYEEVYAKFHQVPTSGINPANAVSANTSTYTAPATPASPYAVTGMAGGSEQYGNDEVPFAVNVPPVTPAPAPTQFTYNAPSVAPAVAPVPTNAPSANHVTCPLEAYGGKFGGTVDKFPQCSGCSYWDDCATEYDRTH